MFRFALAWTNAWAAAEDLAQESYLRLWRSRTKVDWERPLLGWLLVTTRRLAMDRFRSLRRRVFNVPKSATVDEAVWDRWLDVQTAMASLSPLERTALVMTAIEAVSYADAADLLGTSAGALAGGRQPRPRQAGGGVMERSRADRILADWDTVARQAIRPPLPRRTVVTTALPGPTIAGIAGIAVVIVAIAAAGVWLGLPRGDSPGVGVSASPTGASVAEGSIPRCENVPRISAPADWHGSSPIYVANEQPTEEIRAWATGKPGFEVLWIDRDRLGWITVAFSVDAQARQAELEKLFPDVGVVAVGVDWTMVELEGLERRVTQEVGPLFPVSSWTSVTQGVVGIGVGVLRDDRIAAVEERFAGERVCIEGADPADVPAPGPQPQQDEGWRLLADEQGAGHPYRTGIATDQASYERLWTDIGLSGEPPPLDFEAEVVIWFGAVFGSGCENLRLDDVVVDRERALVYAEIVLVDFPAACNDDANPCAYVVALERVRMPAGPFAIQLGADDPPAGAPEERTLVDVDLSRPGAVAAPGDVHPDPSLPEPFVLESGEFLEPGFEYPYRLFVRCGIGWLGRFNDVGWRTEIPDGFLDFIPPEWQTAVDARQTIELSIILRTDPGPEITASANGHTVAYRPTTEEPPGCE